MHVDLTGKTAVVTGAGRGLGQHVAIALAEHGATVAVAARSADQVQQTVEQIQQSGKRALGATLDVGNPTDVEQFSHRVQTELGPVQILINAAGVFGPIQLVAESDADRWIETIQTNTIGPYLLCRAFLSGMLKSGWGRIVSFSSAASLHPPGPLNSAYATSKAALNQFTRHLAVELQGTGVTANVIHPGEVKTEMWAAIRDESRNLGSNAEGYRQWVEAVDRTGGDDPQKTVDLVLNLLSDDAALTTGKFLWIEGGMQTPLPSW